MEDIGHSPLLKFLVSAGDRKMSEPAGIESEVPGEHKLREDDKENPTSSSNTAQNDPSAGNSTLSSGDTGEIATTEDFTLQPVITVTKQESTLTKGEMKLQKVTVTEDISQTSETGEGVVNRRLTYEVHTKIPHPTGSNGPKRENSPIMAQAPGAKNNTDSKRNRTKIPTARFRQAVDKVKNERAEMRNAERVHETVTNTHRKSSIPKLKDSKIPHSAINREVKVSKGDEQQIVNADEDEFDKIFREISEKETTFVVSSSREVVSQVESSFEEIIHAYEDKTEAIEVDKLRQSRIPLLKRRSEHDMELPQNRGRLLLKKRLSIDNDKINSPTTTSYSIESYTTEESKAYAETSAERKTFRSRTSHSSNISTGKHEIDGDENVYNRIETTDDTLNSSDREGDELSDEKQIDIDSIEDTVPIIDEPEETVVSNDVSENYDDISMTSETQLTKISSEQVLFDKQIVSKIYKIDFTENTFELTDSEATTELTNECTKQPNTIESKGVLLSTSVEEKINSNDIKDTAELKYKGITVTTREHKDTINEAVSKSNTTEPIQTSLITHQETVQSHVLDKSDIKYLSKNSSSIEYKTEQRAKIDSTSIAAPSDLNFKVSTNERYTDKTEEAKDRVIKENVATERKYSENTAYLINKYSKKETLGITDKNNGEEIKETTKSGSGLVTKEALIERKETASDESTNENQSTDKTEEGKDTVTKDNLTIERKYGGENTSYLINKYSKKETLDTANKNSGEEIKETTNRSSELVTKEIERKETASDESTTNKKDNKDIVNTASELFTENSIKRTKETQNNNTNLFSKESTKEIKQMDLITKDITKDSKYKITSTAYSAENGTKNIYVKSNSTTDQKETKESSTNYFNSYGRSRSLASYKSIDSSYDITKHSYTPLTDKSPKPEVNGEKIEHDEETYKIYSDVFSKISATLNTSMEYQTKKEESSTTTSTDKNIHHSLTEKESDSEENIPILRGKVSRIIRRISSIDNSKTEDKDFAKEVPKKKSILSKIAMFERDEPYEPILSPRPSNSESKHPRGLAALRQTSRELRKPKIVDEIFKEYSERNKYRVINVENENEDQEEIAIEIKNVKNEIEVNRSDSKFKSKSFDYKIIKDGTEKLETLKSLYPKEETRKEGKRLEEDATGITFSTSVTLNNESELQTKDIIESNTNKKVSEVQYESSYKITNSVSSSKHTNEDTVKTKEITTKADLVDVNSEHSKETINISKIFNRNETNISQRNVESVEGNLTTKEVSKEVRTKGRMERREIQRRDSLVRRATSVVEDDLGDVIKGKVKGLIMRINSIERLEQTRRKIEDRERPIGSVADRIALFEGKAAGKSEKTTEGRRWNNRTAEPAPQEMDEEACLQRIAELKEAKKIYGTTNASYIELRDGAKMPVIALGTALLDKRLVKQVVETAIELGYRAIDTAFIYGNEKEVGEGINAKINDGTVNREDLFIIAKLWSTFHRRDLVEHACKSSLEIMGLTYFDLYLIHNPMSLKEGGDPLPKIANVLQFSEHDYMDAWYGIEDLVAKGLVRSAGLSNFNSEQVHRVTEKGRLKPVVNQVECHPYLSQDRLAGFCDAYGMKLLCFGALGSKGTPKAFKSSLPPAIEDPLVQVMAAGLGVSPAQLLLAFQVRKGRGVVAKASSASHLHENLVAQRLPLSAGQVTALAALDRHKRTYTFEGLGETHKNYPFKIAF